MARASRSLLTHVTHLFHKEQPFLLHECVREKKPYKTTLATIASQTMLPPSIPRSKEIKVMSTSLSLSINSTHNFTLTSFIILRRKPLQGYLPSCPSNNWDYPEVLQWERCCIKGLYPKGQLKAVTETWQVESR